MFLKNRLNIFKKNRGKKKWGREIDPDEIFLDAENLPKFDQHQFEGRMEQPIRKSAVIGAGVIFALLFVTVAGKISILQIKNGNAYAKKAEANTLRQNLIFPDRGIIHDRGGLLLASNADPAEVSEYSRRVYAAIPGMAHVVGYVRYPLKDQNGVYYQNRYEGVDGLEKMYDAELGGTSGLKIVEINAMGKTESESVLEPPRAGENLTLSVDSRVQAEWYDIIRKLASDIGFDGGAGALMDVKTGELLASVSFPEFDSNAMSDRTNIDKIRGFVSSRQLPFLNRMTDGLYTPGSVVKPFIALAALHENVITPEKQILSVGSIAISNPFDPTKKSVFKDWRPQGFVNMAKALAVSSDVYFYEIGGGFEDQTGLGIAKIEKYMRLFGFGSAVPGNPLLPKAGAIPDPAWKAENFQDKIWRIGDTYNTSIGQYGFQVTPMQMVEAVASIANGGMLIEPTILKAPPSSATFGQPLPFSPGEIAVVKEGMRLAVTTGTAKGLDIPQVAVAAKTGTAELGSVKKYVNSWVIGYFPYDKPRFAFVGLMEKGPYSNTIGALYAVRQLLQWMAANTPEYLKES